MGPVRAIGTCLRRYASFSGRAARSEFWWFALAACIVNILAFWADLALFGSETEALARSVSASASATVAMATVRSTAMPISMTVALLMAAPFMAVGWRRLHDVGRSGWWFAAPSLVSMGTGLLIMVAMGQDPLGALGFGFVLGLVSFALSIALIYWLASRGDAGANAHGPAPA